eukprot:744-Pyramimonas_sp.AAC.1
MPDSFPKATHFPQPGPNGPRPGSEEFSSSAVDFEIPSVLWSVHREQVSALPASHTLPAPAAAASVAFRLKPDSTLQLGYTYGSWAATVEGTFHTHHQIPFVGASRATGPSYQVAVVRELQCKRSAPLADFSNNWWTRIHTHYFRIRTDIELARTAHYNSSSCIGTYGASPIRHLPLQPASSHPKTTAPGTSGFSSCSRSSSPTTIT